MGDDIANKVVDYIIRHSSKESVETNGLLLVSPLVMEAARKAHRTDVQVAPGIFQTKQDYEANMAFDEWRDNKQTDGN
jgi:hypothetical protein